MTYSRGNNWLENYIANNNPEPAYDRSLDEMLTRLHADHLAADENVVMFNDLAWWIDRAGYKVHISSLVAHIKWLSEHNGATLYRDGYALNY